MAQLRVCIPRDTLHRKLLSQLGLRWCVKDSRWEKNTSEAAANLMKEDLAAAGVLAEVSCVSTTKT